MPYRLTYIAQPRTPALTPAVGFCAWTTARATRFFLTTNWAMFQKIFVPLHYRLKTVTRCVEFAIRHNGCGVCFFLTLLSQPREEVLS